MSEETIIFLWGGGILFTLFGIIWLIFHRKPFLYQNLRISKGVGTKTWYDLEGKKVAILWSFIFGLIWLIAGLVLLFIAILVQ